MEREKGSGMVSLVREMVCALVDDPGSARVVGDIQGGCLIVRVTVARDDVGKVIGREGRTARSLRQIVFAASVRNKLRCELNIDGFTPKNEER